MPKRKPEIKIGEKTVNSEAPIYIIAELSGNHNQNYSIAKKTIKAAKDAGADAIKLQTYTADTITLDSKKDDFTIKDGSHWNRKNLYDLYKQAYTPWDWQPKLKKYAESIGLQCFSSPFDYTAVDFLEKMNVPAYKIASYEITDIPLIEYVAKKRKPVILSTGVAQSNDIKEAVAACRRVGNNQIAILKCTSAYPTPLEEVNLRTIPDIARKYSVVSGISDHTMGSTVSLAACCLGAKIVEKHLILDRKLGGPDAFFSMEPSDLRQLVQSIRDIEKALGEVTYTLTPSAKKARWNVRSLYAVKDIVKGEKITMDNTRSIRPGFGLHPKYLKKILGKKVKRDIAKGTPLSFGLVD